MRTHRCPPPPREQRSFNKLWARIEAARIGCDALPLAPAAQRFPCRVRRAPCAGWRRPWWSRKAIGLGFLGVAVNNGRAGAGGGFCHGFQARSRVRTHPRYASYSIPSASISTGQHVARAPGPVDDASGSAMPVISWRLVSRCGGLGRVGRIRGRGNGQGSAMSLSLNPLPGSSKRPGPGACAWPRVLAAAVAFLLSGRRHGGASRGAAARGSPHRARDSSSWWRSPTRSPGDPAAVGGTAHGYGTTHQLPRQRHRRPR